MKPVTRFESPILEKVYEIKLDCLIEEKKLDEASSLLKEYRSRFPQKISTSRYKYYLAYINLLKGNESDAFSSFLSLMKKYPTSYWSYKAGVELRENKAKLTSTETYYIALTSYGQDQWFTAIEYFDKYLKNPSNQTYRYKSTLYRANSYYELGKFSKAISEYKVMLKNDVFTEGLYKVGRCYHKLGDRTKAVDYYNRVVKTSPKSNWAAWAMWWMVEFHRENEEWKEVMALCDRLYNSFPRHDLGDNAILWSGIAAYMNEDYGSAIMRFQKITGKNYQKRFRSGYHPATAYAPAAAPQLPYARC